MEGVGARLGRSSTRYGGGPTTVFTGPVRKWHKKWVPLPPANNSSNKDSNSNNSNSNNNSNNGSRLLLYKWAPINGSKESGASTDNEEPPKRKFRYVPIAVVEEQTQEAASKSDDENKTNDEDPSSWQSEVHGSDTKPDINDVPMEDPQAAEQAPTADVKKSNLDLSLGLQAHGDDNERGGENGGQAERLNSGEDFDMQPSTSMNPDNRLKRKVDLEMRM